MDMKDLADALREEGIEPQEISLTQLEYATPERGARYALYIYGRDGLHSGRRYFSNNPEYKDEELTTVEVRKRVKEAITQMKEVRITDGGDMLVFHAANGKVLYPANADDFWKEV